MSKGLAADKRAKLRVVSHCFAGLAALALSLVLGLPAAAHSDDGALDVATLRIRLKDTHAIGLVEKLRLKSEIEDLVNCLVAIHTWHATDTLAGRHPPHSDLLFRVAQLLEHGDASLAHDLTASSDHLWTTLADPGQFAALTKS